jgi:hypothetical protein
MPPVEVDPVSAPPTDALLSIWDSHQDAHPIRRAVAALAAVWPDVGLQGWAGAPVGQRDGCLLDLHEKLFGPELATTARCPRCDERLESTFATADVRVRAPALPTAAPAPLHIRDDGYDVDYRLPNSDDLLAVDPGSGGDPQTGAGDLLRRCVLAVRREGSALPLEALPGTVSARLAQQMASDDPEAEIRLNLGCPACENRWQVTFDIVSYFCGELGDWAQRTLLEIHTLAIAYGWSERQILALSPARRRLYVDMVRG